MITRKSNEEIEIMREGGRITAHALQAVLQKAKPGVSLLDLEKIAQDEIRSHGGEPAFGRVKGYRFATCLNVNEGVVHGIPTGRKIAEGDLLSVDLGTFYRGFNTDAAWTIYVGDRQRASADKLKFLAAGERALDKAISAAVEINSVNDISAAMQKVLEEFGYQPVETLVGHGVGRDLHEDPQVPCLVLRERSPKLSSGMVLAIEVIYTEGNPELVLAEDGWTLATRDQSLSALFEHTVAITKEGPIILTQ